MVHIKPRKKKEGSDPVPPLREATHFSLEGSAPVPLLSAPSNGYCMYYLIQQDKRALDPTSMQEHMC